MPYRTPWKESRPPPPYPPGTSIVVRPANRHARQQVRRLFRDTGDLRAEFYIDEPFTTIVLATKVVRSNDWILIMVPELTGFWWMPAAWASRPPDGAKPPSTVVK